VGWWVTDRIVEPRLGPWEGPRSLGDDDQAPDAAPRGALLWAGLAALGVVLLWAALTLLPGAPLRDATAQGPAQ
ncbi:AbgT family transporter, partial [Pseudomonas reactans]